MYVRKFLVLVLFCVQICCVALPSRLSWGSVGSLLCGVACTSVVLRYCCGICCIVLFRSIGPFDKFIVLFSPIHCLVLLLSLYSFCRHFVAQLLLSCVHLYELIELTHFWLTCFCKPFLQKCPQNVFGFMKVCVLKSKGVWKMLQWFSEVFLLLKTFVITTVIIPESNGLLPLVFNILLGPHI